MPIHPQETFLGKSEIERQFADVLARPIADNPPGAARRFIPRLAYK